MFKEINKQPEHIREIFMWLSVFIVFSLIGFVWFKSFQEKMIVLLNPELEPEEQESLSYALAPFVVLKNGVKDLRSSFVNIGGLFGFLNSDDFEDIDSSFKKSQKIENPNLLPISEKK